MGIQTPDLSLRRRIDKLERLVGSMASQLCLLSRPAKNVAPLSARLWRCTLNENMGATTAGEADANLIELDGSDTLLDVTVVDLLSMASSAEEGDAMYCVEQIDMDGTRNFVVMSAPSNDETGTGTGTDDVCVSRIGGIAFANLAIDGDPAYALGIDSTGCLVLIRIGEC